MGGGRGDRRVAGYILALWLAAFLIRLPSIVDHHGWRYLAVEIWLEAAAALGGASFCVALAFLPERLGRVPASVLVLASLAAIVLFGFISFGVEVDLFCRVAPRFAACGERAVLTGGRNYLWLYGMSYVMILLSRHYEREGVREKRLRACEAMLLAGEAGALIFKLNPTLILGALGSLRRRIRARDTAAAEGLILAIADFMKLSIYRHAAGRATLAEELAYVERHVVLHNCAGGARATVSSDVPAEAAAALTPVRVLDCVVAVALDENATASRTPVHLHLAAQAADGWLTVRVLETGPPRAPAAAAPGAPVSAATSLCAGLCDQATLTCESRSACERVFELRAPLVTRAEAGTLPPTTPMSAAERARVFDGVDPAGPDAASDPPASEVRIAAFFVANIRYLIALGAAAIVLLTSAPYFLAPAAAHERQWAAYILWDCLVGAGEVALMSAILQAAWSRLGPGRLRLLTALLVLGAGLATYLFDEVIRSMVFDHALWRARFYLQIVDRSALVYGAWCFGFFYVKSLSAKVAGERRLAELSAQARRARNGMLRYQLRPHFLFNAMNALHALVLDGRWDRAEETARILSRLVRTSFGADTGDFAPLAAQAEAFETYLAIEKVRFGDRLILRRSIPEDLLAARAPALILQPLVENAMKHAVAATSAPVEVEISAERAGDSLVLRVRDTGGDPQPQSAPGLGVGLSNVAARLAGHYGDRGSLRCERLAPKGFVAEVRLPLEFAATATATAA